MICIESKDEIPYLVKFQDDQGGEHTWVDEYEENGLPALYVDGKGEGQVYLCRTGRGEVRATSFPRPSHSLHTFSSEPPQNPHS